MDTHSPAISWPNSWWQTVGRSKHTYYTKVASSGPAVRAFPGTDLHAVPQQTRSQVRKACASLFTMCTQHLHTRTAHTVARSADRDSRKRLCRFTCWHAQAVAPRTHERAARSLPHNRNMRTHEAASTDPAANNTHLTERGSHEQPAAHLHQRTRAPPR
jgi:hypothetical protein